MIPYWIASTLAATPAFAWVFLGLGLTWSLALLPRADWRDRPLVVALALAAGPTLLTAWMFVLATLGAARGDALLRFDWIIAGTVALALIGLMIAFRRRGPAPQAAPRSPLAFDEKLVIGLIGLALIPRWLGIAYWPFTAYDALWVYGYQGRLYSLLGTIPNTIGYYPPFLPLQYAYGQLAVGGVDDHAARAGLIFLHLGSMLATYALGARLFNRRAGIVAAALWALYPHVGEWSRFGDLEIPLTFLFTLSATFFLMAWTGQEPRRRYAALAGLALGAALWTKPTAGALVWGIGVLLAVELVRLRFDLRAWWPRFQLALITGLCAAPLGGVWYARNLLLGHDPIVLPPSYWQTLAQRSGVEFGWPLLGLLVLMGYLYLGPVRPRPDLRGGLIGLALVLAGLVPSILNPRPMTFLEVVALVAGAGVLGVTLYRHACAAWTADLRGEAGRLMLALLLAAPYFVTWFVSYSYHYRLSFAIVPLMLLPTAVVLARWIQPARMPAGLPRLAYAAAVLAISLPGIVIPLNDVHEGWDWLWNDRLPTDWERYESGNPALMNVVAGLQAYLDTETRPLVVVAPGVRRLPFFFPLEDIRIEAAPTRLDALKEAVYFIDSHPEGTGEYQDVPLLDNQVLSALARQDIMRRAWWMDDGIFRYDVYELHLDNRFIKRSVHVMPREEIVVGGFARLLGYDIGGLEWWPGRALIMHLYWHVLERPPGDYMTYVHLRDAEGRVVADWDGPVARSADGTRYYSTLLWDPKEYITDERTLRMRSEGVPVGEGYSLVVGLYDLGSGARVPITINGKPAGDGYTLIDRIRLLPSEP